MATQPVADVSPVRSRVNVGAVFAGAVVSLAVYLLLSLLGLALGLSVSGHATDTQLGVGAAAWVLASLLIALFCGGFFVSQCTVGETTGEAALYGVILWGLVFSVLLCLTTTGVHLGFNGVLNLASTPAAAPAAPTDEQLAQAGFSKDVIESNRQYFNHLGRTVGSDIHTAAENPQALAAAWWTFAAVLFSMLAAMFGAVCGSGPHVVVAGFPIRHRFVRTVRRDVPVVR